MTITHTPGEIRFVRLDGQLSDAVLPLIIWEQIDEITYIATAATTSYDREAGKPASDAMLLTVHPGDPRRMTLGVPTPVTEGRWHKIVGWTVEQHRGQWVSREPSAYIPNDPASNSVKIMSAQFRQRLESRSLVGQSVTQ